MAGIQEVIKDEDIEEPKKKVEAMNTLKNYACNMKIAVNTTENISSKLSPEDKKKRENEIEKTLQWVDLNQFAEEEETTDKIKEPGSTCMPMFFNIPGQGGAPHVDGSKNLDTTIENKIKSEMKDIICSVKSSSSKKEMASNVASSLASGTLAAALVDASGLADLVDVVKIGIPSGSSPLSYKQQLMKKFRRYIIVTAMSAAIGDVTGLSGQLVVDALVSVCVESLLDLRGSTKAQSRARQHDPARTTQHSKKSKMLRGIGVVFRLPTNYSKEAFGR